MKLSEAIRLGAMLKPQGTGEFLSDGKTCALGAALDAVCVNELDMCNAVDSDLIHRWPILDVMAAIPNDDCTRSVFVGVIRLNDQYGWSREQIADWVESIERDQERADVTANVYAVDHRC